MKLGKMRKVLLVLMGIAISCPTLFAQEGANTEVVAETSTVDGPTAIFKTQAHSSVGMSTTEESKCKYLLEEEVINRIKKEGTAIGESQTIDNIKVTVEYIWADTHTYKVLLSVEHLDQTPFNEEGYSYFRGGRDFMSQKEFKIKKVMENIPEGTSFEDRIKLMATVDDYYKPFIKADGSIDIEALQKSWESEEEEAAISTGTGSSGFSDCEVAGTGLYKKYFILDGSTMDTLEKDMILSLGMYHEVVDKEYRADTDVIDYLNAHKNDSLKTVPYKIDEEEKERMESLKEEDETWYEECLKYLERLPKNMLADEGLKLKVADEVEDYWIDNIGFVDGQLHIKFQGSEEADYWPVLCNEEGERIYATYHEGKECIDEEENLIAENYMVFPVKDLEELKQYQLILNTEVATVETKDAYTFDVKMNLIDEKVIPINKRVSIVDEKANEILDSENKEVKDEVTLKSMTQTDLSLIFECAYFDSEGDNTLCVEAFFKDYAEGERVYESASITAKDKKVFIYDISQFAEEIEKVVVGGVEIKLN